MVVTAMTRQERTTYQMQIQSLQIEKLLSRHQIKGSVAGGEARQRLRHQSVAFDLQFDLEAGMERLRAFKEDLVAALGVPDVHLSRANGRWRLELCQANPHPVDLLDMLAAVPDVPPCTAVLGVSDPADSTGEADGITPEGQPVLLDMLAPDVSHILVSGDSGAGKTVLLRTLAVSLALSSRQSELQLLVVEPSAEGSANSGRLLRPLNYLPHMLAPVVRTVDEMMDLADFLIKEIAYRCEQQVATPAIVLLVDEAVTLLAAGGRKLSEVLAKLLQQGAAAGVHVVLAANDAASPLLSRLMRAHLPIRLVGQTVDAAAAFAASGTGVSQAAYLLGRGDFLAVTYASQLRFQAAHITDSDLHLVLNRLHRQRAPVLTAQPWNVRPTSGHEETGNSPLL
jgi:DNA segregation ATPase FtsK/SpoIIIE, S-DNA-T family